MVDLLSRIKAAVGLQGQHGEREAVRTTGLDDSQKQFFAENGYLILPGFFDAAEVARVKAHIGALWAARGPDCPLVINYYIDGELQHVYLRDIDDAVRDLPYKLNDVHLSDPVFQDIATDARLVAVLRNLLSATPLVCNTLLMERGSQQRAHFDTFYMPSITPNMMCASWIALDPSTDANGPLFYYPKSHLIEPFRFSSGKLNAIAAEMDAAHAHIDRIIVDYGLEEERFHPEPGDVLIWHAQLLHGGSRIDDLAATRSSLVTHYWTTLDYPDPDSWIVVGDGRYLLRRPHLTVIPPSDREAVIGFVRGLTTPPDIIGECPAGFDPVAYLLRNMDVFRFGMDPYVHYVRHGRGEGRNWW